VKLTYELLSLLIRLIAGLGRSDRSKDIELLVLRKQLEVLHRVGAANGSHSGTSGILARSGTGCRAHRGCPEKGQSPFSAGCRRAELIVRAAYRRER
jgi:hypothetical protein